MKKTTKFLALMGIIGLGVTASTTVHAEEDKDKQEVGFQISPILPESQNKEITSYFSIDWKPGATEKFGLKFENNTKQELKYKVEFNRAITNANGIFVYSDSDQNKGFAPVESWVKFPKEVTIKPGETKDLMGEVTMPNEDLEGKLLAGLYIHEDIKVDPSKPQVTQTQSYAMPFSFRGNKPLDKGNIKFGTFKVDQTGPRMFSIITPFENENQIMSSEGTREVVVKDLKGKEVFKNESDLEVAPLTKTDMKFDIPTALEDDEYQVDVTLKTKFGEFKDSQKVKIPKEVKKNLKETYAQEPTKSNNTLLYVVIGLLVLILIVILVKNKKEKDDKVEAKTDSTPETKTEPKEETTSENKEDAKTEPKEEVTPEVKEEAKSDSEEKDSK